MADLLFTGGMDLLHLQPFEKIVQAILIIAEATSVVPEMVMGGEKGGESLKTGISFKFNFWTKERPERNYPDRY